MDVNYGMREYLADSDILIWQGVCWSWTLDFFRCISGILGSIILSWLFTLCCKRPWRGIHLVHILTSE